MLSNIVMSTDRTQLMQDIKAESKRVYTFEIMLYQKIGEFCENDGMAGLQYSKNHNSSKTAILDLIKTVRNELLVLSEEIKKA